MKSRKGSAGCIWFALLSALACGGSAGTDTPSPTELSLIILSPTIDSLQAGVQHELTIRLRFLQVTPSSVTLSVKSSNPTVVSSGDAVVIFGEVGTARYLAVGPGSATLTFSKGRVSSSLDITVTPTEVAFITVTPANPVMAMDDSLQLQARALDQFSRELPGRVLTWSTASSTVALGSPPGMLHALSPGGFTVTVRAENAQAAIDGTVTPPPIARVTIWPSSLDVGQDVSDSLVAHTFDAKGRDIPRVPVTFVSEDPGTVLLYDLPSGRVRGIAIGSTTVTATSGTSSATAVVRVVPNPVASLRFEETDSLRLFVGGSATRTPLLFDSLGRGLTRPVTYSSSLPSVATTEGGVVTAVSPGAAIITAVAEGHRASYPVKVRAIPLTVSLSPLPSRFTRIVGQSMFFHAVTRDSGGNVLKERQVVWSTTTPTLVEVTPLGVVSALAPGDATVIATSDGVSATAPLKVLSPDHATDYNIEVAYPVSTAQRVRDAMQRAIARVQAVIVGDLSGGVLTLRENDCYPGAPPVSKLIDDLLVIVQMTRIESRSYDVAGPCVLRAGTNLPAAGAIILDSVEVASYGDRFMDDVMLHNLLHVIGMSEFLWEEDSLFTGETADPAFLGPQAGVAFRAAGGQRYPDRVVPVAPGNGSGLWDHWRYSITGLEISSAFYSAGDPNPLSAITVGALKDLGYQVNLAADDGFLLDWGNASSAMSAGRLRSWQHGVLRPVFMVDANFHLLPGAMPR